VGFFIIAGSPDDLKVRWRCQAGLRNLYLITIRFGLALGTSPEMWLRLQAQYELEKAQDESDPDLENKIKKVFS
jgi:hypothetical protein